MPAQQDTKTPAHKKALKLLKRLTSKFVKLLWEPRKALSKVTIVLLFFAVALMSIGYLIVAFSVERRAVIFFADVFFTLEGICSLFAAFYLIGYFITPKIGFVPFRGELPGFARTNTPRREWDEEERRRRLPTGVSYTLPCKKRGHFVLLYDWPVFVKIGDQSWWLKIPALTQTDYASIPPFLQSFLNPINNSIYASVLHDYIYRDPEDPVANSISKSDADLAFYWGMRLTGVREDIAGIMYLAVVAFGRSSYKRSKKS
jgi:hypothetical protein